MSTVEKIIEKLINLIEGLLAFLLLLMVLNVSYDVIMRYFFHNSSVAMQELEWHFFAIIILFGISVSLQKEAHVRVDFLFERFSKRVQAAINIFGTLFFLIPLALLIATGSLTFVYDAWVIGEISEDPGGLAVSTVLVGTLLAASTGVVGASVIAMGVISLPVMLKHGYDKSLATGTICASGTLGQIIPPSIVLIILGDVFQLPVGDLFHAALKPGLVLVGSYIAYILCISYLQPQLTPVATTADQHNPEQKSPEQYTKEVWQKALLAILPPLGLIALVLGSIFAGIATPTESAAVGALGSMVLAAIYKKLDWHILLDSCRETVRITAMVFAVLIGATAFSMVFVYTGADILAEEFMLNLPGEKWGFLLLSMAVIMFLGFFIDFIEISYIVVPILLPIAETVGIDPMWFALLIAMNLQTSFLTPPFGFSLFYLKGVCPSEVQTLAIYKGVLPFIILQVMVLGTLMFFPHLYGLGR